MRSRRSVESSDETSVRDVVAVMPQVGLTEVAESAVVASRRGAVVAVVWTNGWSVYCCAPSLVVRSTTVSVKVTIGLPAIQSTWSSVGLAVAQPVVSSWKSSRNRVRSFMSPVRSSGVSGALVCSSRRVRVSIRTAASRMAGLPPTASAGWWVLSTQMVVPSWVEVNRTSGTWMIGRP